jgi:hypothetical protein
MVEICLSYKAKELLERDRREVEELIEGKNIRRFCE